VLSFFWQDGFKDLGESRVLSPDPQLPFSFLSGPICIVSFYLFASFFSRRTPPLFLVTLILSPSSNFPPHGVDWKHSYVCRSFPV